MTAEMSYIESLRKDKWRMATPTVVLLAMTATSLIFSPVVANAASQTTTISWRGNSAYASMSSQSLDGVNTDVYVFATDTASRQNSGTFDQSQAYFYIYQYKLGDQICQVSDGQEYCYNQTIPIVSFNGYAPSLDANSFQMKKLNTASLQTTMTGFDWVSNSEKTITINATWTGVGSTSSGNYVTTYRSGNYLFHSQYVGSSRQGDITIGISGDVKTNIDSNSANYKYVELDNAKTGSVTISTQ
jgi:hypothetical protein